MIESLPPDLQQFVSDELANGHYRSEENCWSMPFVSIVTAARSARAMRGDQFATAAIGPGRGD